MNLKIDWRAPEDLTLQSDPARVRQVLMSIIDNAIKFSDKGGEVRLQVDLHSAPVAANSQVSILVEDNGLGMTPEQQDRLFQPFVQGDSSMSRRYGGTGLGLILSQKIARTLGGDVALLRSTVGLGSAFLITFPLAVERKESPTSSHSGASGQSGHNLQGVQILLVEDSLDNQALIRRFLEMEGAIVECANHGEEGLRFALAHPFDVILLDIQMPVLDGYETIRQLRAHNYNRPVIALTAHAMQGERDRCLALGFTSYVTKPISRARLVETLKPYSLAEKQAPGPVQNVHISSPSAV